MKAEKQGVPLKCHKCGHEWPYTGTKKIGQRVYVTCPSCHYLVNLAKQKAA